MFEIGWYFVVVSVKVYVYEDCFYVIYMFVGVVVCLVILGDVVGEFVIVFIVKIL